jgi:hypothetical protein
MMQRFFTFCLFLCMAFAANEAAAQVQRTYSFHALGQPDDFFGTIFRAAQVGISDAGEPLVFGGDDAFESLIRWTPSGGPEILVGQAGISSSIVVKDVSDDGSAVAAGIRFSSLGFRWTEANGVENLTPLPGQPGALRDVIGISPDGAWMSGYSMPDPANVNDLPPTVWANPSSPYELDRVVVPLGSQSFVANDVVEHNGDIWSVGNNNLFGGNSQAFVWKNEEIIYIGGGNFGTATNVAVAGEKIRVVWRPDEYYGILEFDPVTGEEIPGSRVLLPSHPLSLYTLVHDMTSDGNTIVGSLNPSDPLGTHAYVWEQGDSLWGSGSETIPGLNDWQATSLHDLLMSNLSLGEQLAIELADWTFEDALGVATRQFGDETVSAIVGHGTNPDGQFESFLITVNATTVPEPASVWLMLIAIASCGVLRMRTMRKRSRRSLCQ